MCVDTRAVEPSVVGIGRQIGVEQLFGAVEHTEGPFPVAMHVEGEDIGRTQPIVREKRAAASGDADLLGVALDAEPVTDGALVTG